MQAVGACAGLALIGAANAFVATGAMRSFGVPKVAKASVHMSVSDEPWFADAVATVVVDKATLE